MDSNLLVPGITLVGIMGHAGSGKDFVGNCTLSRYDNCYIEAFSDSLKKGCAEIFGLTEYVFNAREYKEQEDPFWNVSPRKILQFVGTEFFRDAIIDLIPGITDNFWIKRLAGKLNGLSRSDSDGAYCNGDTVVITDVRFKNEFQWILDNNGVIIQLIRPGISAVGLANHASESSFITEPQIGVDNVYVIFNTGTLENLNEKVQEIIDNISAKH